jgi:FkbM family methyltransferase
MKRKVALAQIPVELECPDEMLPAIREVLSGEYESWYFGEGLTILDVGANVGSFSIWANLRWPDSRIHAYEPHPDTFRMLVDNVRGLTNVTCHNTAVYPTDREREPFWSRYGGDGESGLVAYMGKTFADLSRDNVCEVPVLHPRELPQCDVIKADVEGAEAPILMNMNLEQVSLILLEYQNDENRNALKERLSREFILDREDSFEWDALLPESKYRKDLSGDHYGRLFFSNRKSNKLRKVDRPQPLATLPPQDVGSEVSLRKLLSALPGATKLTLRRRLASWIPSQGRPSRG